MSRWIMEWLTVSIFGVFGVSLVFVFSTLWSLIPAHIAQTGLGSLDTEGKAALILLFVIGVGCVKLFSNHE